MFGSVKKILICYTLDQMVQAGQYLYSNYNINHNKWNAKDWEKCYMPTLMF